MLKYAMSAFVQVSRTPECRCHPRAREPVLIFGFAPRLIYTYTSNYSNVGLYAYDKHSVVSLLTRAF
jgi:hypothetical protein